MDNSLAEKIFYDFGTILETQSLLKPEQYGKYTKGLSRMELRKAILIWIAKEKYEGTDIQFRKDLGNGKRVAVLELAFNIWPYTGLFGPIKENGLPIMDTDKESNISNTMHDKFVDFILNLDRKDSDYWQKVEIELNKLANL